MGSLNLYADPHWRTPVVSLPGSEKWTLIDRYIIDNGFVASLSGLQMMFLDTSNYWISLVSRTAALRVSQIIGNEKASVNYSDAFSPYYSKMTKSCSANSTGFVPTSVCIGTKRLTIECIVYERKLKFQEVEPLLKRKKFIIPSFVYGLCYQPTDHIYIPSEYTFPGTSHVLNFLQPLFPDFRTMITYLWIIGNAARDPVARARFLLLCGPGGSGKSTALRMAMAALSGACSLIPDNILTRTFDGLGDTIASTVVKSRLVVCFELDLDNKEVNMSVLKNITGGDFLRIGEYMAKAVCSFMVATNGVPNGKRQPEFRSDALSRRLVAIKMDVDTADAPYEPDPGLIEHTVDLLCASLYVRMIYSHLPISPDNFLLTLCQESYFVACRYVTEESSRTVTIMEGKAVIAILSGILDCHPEKLVNRCRLISMSAIAHTSAGYLIKGLVPVPGLRI
jgi:hypothetical protein